MEIKFSHNYPKLHNQKTAKLIRVEKLNRWGMTDEFIEYDTSFDGGKYELILGKYLLLVFLGNDKIPFTTARPWNPEKERYYTSLIGKTFDVKVKP